MKLDIHISVANVRVRVKFCKVFILAKFIILMMLFSVVGVLFLVWLLFLENEVLCHYRTLRHGDICASNV